MNYRVGVCQFQPKLLDVSYNLSRMENMLNEMDADLIVLPELANSGYVFCSQEEVERVAEDAYEGKTAVMLRRLARERNTSYVVGIAERADGKLYNSAILVNPDGGVHVYRKTHLFFEEKLFFEPGDTGFLVHEAKNQVKIGMMICFDWQFPEATRTLSLRGAEIICHPSNLVLPWCQQAMLTRSLENRVFSITCNRIGKEINMDKIQTFTGMSQVVSTKGEILTRLETDREGTDVVEIEPELARNKQVTAYNDAFKDRRPDMYAM